MKIGKIKYSLVEHSYFMFCNREKLNNIFLLMEFIPTEIKRECIHEEIYVVYTGTSKLFTDIEEGDPIPEYTANIVDGVLVIKKEESEPPSTINLGKFKLLKKHIHHLPKIIKELDIILTDVKEKDDYFMYYGMSPNFGSVISGNTMSINEYYIYVDSTTGEYSLKK